MASSHFDSDSDDEITDINIVPLVDIVLVLLIIFMVTAQFLAQKDEPDPAIEIELPKAVTAQSPNNENEQNMISLVITKEGNLYMDGKSTDQNAIKTRITEIGPLKAEVFVAADKDIAHGDVVSLIDGLRLLGVQRFGINTKPQDIIR
jgi:biopolymer transport protein ExbD